MVYKICAFQKRVKIFTVVYDRNEKKLECECCHWDHEGYPCSLATMWMSFLMAQEVPLFGDTMNEVTRWTKDLEKRCSNKMQNGITDVLHPAAKFVGDPCVAMTKGAPKLKENETRKRSCSNCFVKGHTKRHCPKLVDEGDRSHDHLPSRCTDTDEATKDPLGATRSENNGRNCTTESSTKLMGSQSNLAGTRAFSGVQFYPTLSNLFLTPQGGVANQPLCKILGINGSYM
ncbi:hypothetical protein AHAS_Ahas09G0081700 [Arachis hypogaea]